MLIPAFGFFRRVRKAEPSAKGCSPVVDGMVASRAGSSDEASDAGQKLEVTTPKTFHTSYYETATGIVARDEQPQWSFPLRNLDGVRGSQSKDYHFSTACETCLLRDESFSHAPRSVRSRQSTIVACLSLRHPRCTF